MVHHSEISRETLFGCELTIPGIDDYKVREESTYKHRGGRKCLNPFSFLI